MLFTSWRNEAELKTIFDTYEERWQNFMNDLKTKSTDAFNDIKKVIKNQTMQLQMEQEIYDKRREMKEALKIAEIDEEPEDQLELFDRVVDEQIQEKDKERMNDGQKKIFHDIIDHIQQQNTGAATEAFRLFITGTAGTGKSFLIRLLADELTLLYTDKTTKSTRPAAILGAPTGLAAIQINASTLHSLFNIGVQHGREGKLEPVSPQNLNLKRLLFSNLKLLIIDEISMVSNIMLAKIHMRLTEFMNKNEPFGGVNILVFGKFQNRERK